MTPYAPTTADLLVLEHTLGWQSDRSLLLEETFGIGKPSGTWRLELEQRRIHFHHADGSTSVAEITVAGTYDPDTGTFLWWWANPNRDTIPHPEAQAMYTPSGIETPEAEALDHLGRQPLISVSEGGAFALAAALALRLGAAAAYRTRSGSLWIYWVLHTVTDVPTEAVAS
jgi:hypothetical protein